MYCILIIFAPPFPTVFPKSLPISTSSTSLFPIIPLLFFPLNVNGWKSCINVNEPPQFSFRPSERARGYNTHLAPCSPPSGHQFPCGKVERITGWMACPEQVDVSQPRPSGEVEGEMFTASVGPVLPGNFGEAGWTASPDPVWKWDWSREPDCHFDNFAFLLRLFCLFGLFCTSVQVFISVKNAIGILVGILWNLCITFGLCNDI